MTKPDPMKAKVAMFKEATSEARELHAKTVLHPETVSEQMARAAALGHSAVKIDVKGVNITRTQTAGDLVKRLTAAGANCEWVQRTLGDAGTLKYSDLIISWD